MPLFGSHLSIAGGYFKAAETAGALGMETVQIFTKNNNQWAGKPISEEDVALFRESIERHNLVKPCSHASYLINLASPKEELWEKSIAALADELERASVFRLEGVVFHPGSFVDSSEIEGLGRIVAAIDRVHELAPRATAQLWLETTAGQGSNLGWRFEQLAHILKKVARPERLGICLDTCHIMAAGYAIETEDDYRKTMEEFDRVIGLKWLRAFHLNDSKKPRGSRVDRHEHIGEGHLGLDPFRWLLNDERFAHHPMYLETEKGERDGEDLDAINLRTLKSLITNG